MENLAGPNQTDPQFHIEHIMNILQPFLGNSTKNRTERGMKNVTKACASHVIYRSNIRLSSSIIVTRHDVYKTDRILAVIQCSFGSLYLQSMSRILTPPPPHTLSSNSNLSIIDVGRNMKLILLREIVKLIVRVGRCLQGIERVVTVATNPN